MPGEPLRFIHAARLLLDHQLHGVGPLPEPYRPVVQDATITAFQQIVRHCLDQKVDFLLLAGDSFDAADIGWRGQKSLAEGCWQLADADIPVFLAAGKRDPWRSWLPGLSLPESTFFVGRDDLSPLVIRHENEEVAQILGVPLHDGLADKNFFETHTEVANPGEGEDGGLYTIILLPGELEEHARSFTVPGAGTPVVAGIPLTELVETRVHYWALGGAASRKTLWCGRAAVHDPGAPQGIRPQDVGPRGCSLVEVGADRSPRWTTLPAGPVRFENLSLQVNEATHYDELLATACARLTEMERHPSDQLWLLNLRISGVGPLVSQFADDLYRQIFVQDLQESLPELAVPCFVYQLRWWEEPSSLLSRTEAESLQAQYLQLLAERWKQPVSALHRCLQELPPEGSLWEQRLQQEIAELDVEALGHLARQHGLRWFAA